MPKNPKQLKSLARYASPPSPMADRLSPRPALTTQVARDGTTLTSSHGLPTAAAVTLQGAELRLAAPDARLVMERANAALQARIRQLQAGLERQRVMAKDLHNILNSSGVATLLLDIELKIRYFTPATRALFPLLTGDIGRPLADLAALAPDPALPEDARLVLETLKPIECAIETRDGLWFARRILPYRAASDAVEGVVITFTDISDRKEVERALEHAKALAESANLAKSRFLATASHDLRQPLQSLMLLHDLLVRSVENERVRQLVARLGQTLATINAMMNTLLDIHQIEAGVVVPSRVDFPLQEIFDRMRREFAPQARAQRLELRVVATRHVIRSDPRLFEQMTRNLIANALKFTRRGKVLLGCRRHGAALRIEIWDSGIGIPQGQLQAIFNEYHQINNAMRERSRGLGLGLAIVQRLSDLLGHKVGVRSQLDHGSVFAIEVAPTLDKAEQLAPAAGKQALLPPRGLGVLVVEDEPAVADLLAWHLAGEGHRVETAADGVAALALVAKGFVPDLLLADFNLPHGFDGLALAASLRDRLMPDLPVIILTGDISACTLRRIADAGALQLNKPVATADLAHAMRALTGARPAPPASAAPGAAENLIFIVDDDPEIREQMRALLAQAGMRVESFASAEAFISAAVVPKAGACLVLDAYLPGLSGLDLLRRLRRQGEPLPVVMMTGHADVSMAVEAMKSGAADFIEKPIGAAALLASIAAAVAVSQESQRGKQAHEVAKSKLARLTPRQREIMARVLAGHPSKNIAADLGISQRTVESHRASIMLKTATKSLPALARLAYDSSEST